MVKKEQDLTKTYDYSRKHAHHMVIYNDDTMKNYQIVHPSVAFDGNWKALAYMLRPHLFKFEVR